MRDPLAIVKDLIVPAPVVKLKEGTEYTVPQIEAKLRDAADDYYAACQNTASSKFDS